MVAKQSVSKTAKPAGSVQGAVAHIGFPSKPTPRGPLLPTATPSGSSRVRLASAEERAALARLKICWGTATQQKTFERLLLNDLAVIRNAVDCAQLRGVIAQPAPPRAAQKLR